MEVPTYFSRHDALSPLQYVLARTHKLRQSLSSFVWLSGVRRAPVEAFIQDLYLRYARRPIDDGLLPGFLADDKARFTHVNWEVTMFLVAIAIHMTVFRKGEWDLFAKSICGTYLVVFVASNALLLLANAHEMSVSLVSQTIVNTTKLFFIHFAGLATSICVYRCLFHHLRRFPGPFVAALSNWYTLKYSLLHQHPSEELEKLHQKHGHYVRIGPNKLSVTDPAAFKAIYGRNSPAGKGAFYNITYPRTDLHMTRDKADHARRRKHWDRGLSVSEMRHHVSTVVKHERRLISQIQAHAGQAFNIVKWLDMYGFDVMFDVAFGKDIGRLIRGEEDYYLTCAHETLKLMSLFMHVPWIIHFFTLIPSLAAKFHKFQAYSETLVRERFEQPEGGKFDARSDVFSFIMKTYYELPNKTPKDMLNLTGEADLIILAGSDSMAVAISTVLYQLAKHPKEQLRLRRELTGLDDAERLQIMGNAELDAVIHESMRLIPLAPNGHERMTPAEGLFIGDVYIPGHTTVSIPNYTMWRDPRYFQHPLQFIPQRWTTRSELTKDASVFIPFQMGAYACPGRNLAYMVVRAAVTVIVSRYHIQPGSHKMEDEYLDKRDDRWLLAVSTLDLKFEELT